MKNIYFKIGTILVGFLLVFGVRTNAQDIKDIFVSDVTPFGFVINMNIKSQSQPFDITQLTIFSDSSEISAITNKLAIVLFPLHGNDSNARNEYDQELQKQTLKNRMANRGVFQIGVFECIPDTIYYYKLSPENVLRSVKTSKQNEFIENAPQLLVNLHTKTDIFDPQGFRITVFSDKAVYPITSVVGDGASENQALVNLSNFFNQAGTNFFSKQTFDVIVKAQGNGLTPFSQTVSIDVQPNFSVANRVDLSFDSAPKLSEFVKQEINEDTKISGLVFDATDLETPSTELEFSIKSSNPVLIPEGNISIEHSGATYKISATPVANVSGDAIITVTVSDGINEISGTLAVHITPVNDPPIISKLDDVVMDANTTLGPRAFTVTDIDNALNELTINATTDNSRLFPQDAIIIENQTITLKPKIRESGAADITLTVSDGKLMSSSSFHITVNKSLKDLPYGDLNGDERVDLVDLILSLQILSDIDTVTYVDVNLAKAVYILNKISGIKYHSADYNPRDFKINISELLRIVQFYNVGGFACAPSSEDSYTPVYIGVNSDYESCQPHSADYVHDWKIDSDELMRIIGFYNTGCYVIDSKTEDSFLPVPCGKNVKSRFVQPEIVSGRIVSDRGVKRMGSNRVKMTIVQTIDWQAISLGLRVKLPNGWRYLGVNGESVPEIVPQKGQTDTLNFIWITIPERFDIDIELSGNPSGSLPNIKSELIYQGF